MIPIMLSLLISSFSFGVFGLTDELVAIVVASVVAAAVCNLIFRGKRDMADFEKEDYRFAESFPLSPVEMDEAGNCKYGYIKETDKGTPYVLFRCIGHDSRNVPKVRMIPKEQIRFVVDDVPAVHYFVAKKIVRGNVLMSVFNAKATSIMIEFHSPDAKELMQNHGAESIL